MWRFWLLYKVVKFLCYIMNYLGFLKIRFDRSTQLYHLNMGCRCISDYWPGILLIWINVCHFAYLSLSVFDKYDYDFQKFDELNPCFTTLTFIIPCCHLVAYVYMICRYMRIKFQLWCLVQQAQFIYNHLSSLLRKRLVLKCSWLVFILAAVQILLIIFLSWKLFWLNWTDDIGYDIAHYLMGLVHLIFALHLSLHVFYHLLNAALLHSLNLLVQQLHIPKDLKLLRHLLYVQPSLRKMQHLAGYYFGETFCWFFFLLYLKGGILVNNFRYDDTTLNQNKKSLDDIEDEADWADIEAPPTRDQQLRTAALELMWQVALLLPLICAAYVQQREYKKLLNGIWKIEFPRTKKAAKKDIVSFLLSTRMSMVDYRTSSITFMALKPKSDVAIVQTAGVVGSFKKILFMMLCTTIVDFVKQMDLMRYENYLKQNFD